MRKVAFTVAAIGLIAIVWGLWPRGGEDAGTEGAGVSEGAARPARASSAASGAGSAAAAESGTPELEQPASTAEGALEVRVSGRGQPRPGARVRLYWRGPPDPNTNVISWRLAGTGTTGSDGVARLPARPGTYLVVARGGDGLAPARRELVRPAGEPTTRVELSLAPGVTLQARTVSKKSGEAVPLVEVRLTASARPGARPEAPPEEQVFATSDAQGQVKLDGLAPGPYRAEARSVGYGRWSKEDLELPFAGVLSIPLEAAGVMEGFVVDAADKPAEGATVMVIGDEEPVAVTTGPGGGFSAEVVGGTYQLSARRGSESAALQRPVIVPAGATVRGLTLKLGAGCALDGRVVAATGGQPVSGAQVAVSPYLKSGDSGRAVSAADGTFAVEGLAPGSYDVVVSAPGYSEEAKRGVTLIAGQRFPLKVTLHGTGEVEGTVTDSAGRPAAGVSVREGGRFASSALTSPPSTEARSGPDGRYHLSGVSVGRVRLVARREGEAAGGASQEVQVQEGKTAQLDFALDDAAILEGRVTTARGGPPAKPLRVLAMPRQRIAAWSRTFAAVGADGSYRLELPPGTYAVTTSPADFSSWRSRDMDRQPVTLEAGKTQRLDLVAADEGGTGRTVSGAVLEADGTPSPGAEVSVTSGDASAFGHSDAEGRFSFSLDMKEPDASVRVFATNGGRRGEVTASNADAPVEVRLKASATLRGKLLVGEGGKPVEGFTLMLLSGRHDGDRDGRSFSGDQYELYDVPTGPVRLRVVTEDGRQGEAQTSLDAPEGELDIPLEQSATVTGRVVDAATRKPISDGFVSITGVRGEGFTRLELDGSFKVANVTPGEGRGLHIWAGSRVPMDRKVTLEPGQVLDLGELAMEPMRAEPGSVGAQLRIFNGQVVLDWLMPDGPAQRAGVHPGDVLVSVDGQAVQSVFDAGMKLRGAPGTAVLVTVRRGGTEQTLSIRRAGES